MDYWTVPYLTVHSLVGVINKHTEMIDRIPTS